MKHIIQIYKLILPYLWKTRKLQMASLLTLVLIIVDVIAATYFPYAWKQIIGADRSSHSPTWFVHSGLILFALWMTKKLAPHLRKITFFNVINEAIRDVRFKTILKSHTISLLHLEKYNIQEILNATGRVSQSIRHFMQVSFISIVPSLSKIVSLSIALASVDILCFGILAAAYTGLGSAVIMLRHYTHAKRKAWHLSDTVTVAAGNSLYNTKSVRFVLYQEESKLGHLFHLETKAWGRHNTILNLLHIIQDTLFYMGTAVVFSVLLYRYGTGDFPLESLVLVYGLVTSLYSPMLDISRSMTRFLGGVVDIRNTMELLNMPDELRTAALPSTPNCPIIIDHASFAYPSKKPNLIDITLTIQPGDKIGIFGPSGSGKSTLCQLIAGLASPQTGRIRYGDVDLSTIPMEQLGTRMCYIPQDNLPYVIDPHQHEYGIHLKRKPLSGGEHQRELLERALQHKPEIIILDETTNALDRQSIDTLLQKVIDTVPTIIMVTHRQKTLEKMERIFELKYGHLTEIKPNSN